MSPSMSGSHISQVKFSITYLAAEPHGLRRDHGTGAPPDVRSPAAPDQLLDLRGDLRVDLEREVRDADIASVSHDHVVGLELRHELFEGVRELRVEAEGLLSQPGRPVRGERATLHKACSLS